MRVLESKLLKHIRNLGIWHKYYNDNLPDYDFSDGETFWTWCRKAEERKKEKEREKNRSPQRKLDEAKRRQDPNRKAYIKIKNAVAKERDATISRASRDGLEIEGGP